MILLWSSINKVVNLLVVVILFSIIGACAMSDNIELTWEWPDGRVSDQKFLIKVNNVESKSSGFFGIGKSPSIASNIPSPVVLTGEILKDEMLEGKSIKVTLPKLELESIKSGDYAVVGVMDGNTCICIVKVASSSEDISKVSCP